MSGDEVAYEPVRPFEQWTAPMSAGSDFTVIDRAVERLRTTRAATGGAHADLSAKASLLLAALHTGAVEGVHTMNRGVTLTALDNVLGWERFVEDAEGTDARRHVEAALDAYDLALDAAVRDDSPVSEAWLREVHKRACAAQDTVRVRTPVGDQQQPFERGVYKRDANHVLLADGRVHWYAPPDQVVTEVYALVGSMRSSPYARAHPVLQAAYSHHALTTIHPFQDGNGRVARVLASVPLLRWASIPFHLYEDQVAEYFDALAAADDGDPAPFVEFVRERTLDLVFLTDDRLTATVPVTVPEPPNRPASIVAERIAELVLRCVRNVAEEQEVPSYVQVSSFEPWRSARSDPTGRSHVGRHSRLHLEAGRYFVDVDLPVFVDESLESAYPIAIGEAQPVQLELRLNDVHPEISQSVRTRIDAFIRRRRQEALAELAAEMPS